MTIRGSDMLRPVRASQWTPALAAHLLNRAGFGGSPNEVAAFAASDPEQAVRRLLAFRTGESAATPPAWVEQARPGGPRLRGVARATGGRTSQAATGDPAPGTRLVDGLARVVAQTHGQHLGANAKSVLGRDFPPVDVI